MGEYNTENWARENKAGHARASRVITRLLETGDASELLHECRNLDSDPFHSVAGIAFFTHIAVHIAKG